jgi:hypothetical protein
MYPGNNNHELSLAAKQAQKELFQEAENQRLVRELKNSQKDARRSLKHRLGHTLLNLGQKLAYEPEKPCEQA